MRSARSAKTPYFAPSAPHEPDPPDAPALSDLPDAAAALRESSQPPRESMYVELLQDMICTVLEAEHHLFSAREQLTLSQFFLMSYEARYLCARLLLRKDTWYRLDRLAYSDLRDVGAAAHELCCPFAAPDEEPYSFAAGDADMEGGVATRLELLTLEELRAVAKKLGAPRTSTRTDTIAALLRKPQNATLCVFGHELGMSERASPDRLEAELHRVMQGGCVRLAPSVRALIERVALVYHRGRPALGSMLTGAVLSRTRRMHFPTYVPQRTPDLWASRAQLLAYEDALRLMEQAEACVDELRTRPDAAEEGMALLDASWDAWRGAVRDAQAAHLHGAHYVRLRFHPGWALTRVVDKACDCLARLGHFAREARVLRALLAQRIFWRARRGPWYERLAVLTAKWDKRAALITCLAALDDTDTHFVHVDAFQRRVERLEAQLHVPPAERHRYAHALRAARTVVLAAERADPWQASARPVAHRGALPQPPHGVQQGASVFPRALGPRSNAPAPAASGLVSPQPCFLDPLGRVPSPTVPDTCARVPSGARCTWRGLDGTPCSVEQLCLQHYARQGYRGFHCEGNVVRFLFVLLMWDVLFMPMPGAFETPYQREPLDLATDVFCVARRDAIAARLADLEASGGVDLLRATDARERPRRTMALACAWDDYTAEELVEIATCFGGRALSTICRLLCEDWAMRSSGFPDLLLWRMHDRQVRIVEVKSPNDRLSENQKVWIDVLLCAGVPVDLAKVETACAPPRRRARSASPQRPRVSAPRRRVASASPEKNVQQ